MAGGRDEQVAEFPSQFLCAFPLLNRKQRARFQNSNSMQPAKAMRSSKPARKRFPAAPSTMIGTAFVAPNASHGKARLKKSWSTKYRVWRAKTALPHHFVETLEDCDVSLYWHAQAIETLLPNGNRNPAAGIMLALLAEMARNESETLRERIKSGLAHARKNGVVLGRPKGTALDRAQFLRKHRDIVRQLKASQSLRNVARIVGKGVSTVQRVKAALGPLAS